MAPSAGAPLLLRRHLVQTPGAAPAWLSLHPDLPFVVPTDSLQLLTLHWLNLNSSWTAAAAQRDKRPALCRRRQPAAAAKGRL